MPCPVRTLKPCQKGRCSAQPQASSWKPRCFRASKSSSPCFLNGRSQLPLSQRYGPAIIPYELVAENGLFQPKLMIAPKTPKLTPRLDPPEVGTRQLTLCPSHTNSQEPSPDLVPSEVLASGHHGFVKWGHNCQNGKIGCLGRPSRVGNLGDGDAPSLDSQPLISPSVPCPGLSLAVTLAAYCSPRG